MIVYSCIDRLSFTTLQAPISSLMLVGLVVWFEPVFSLPGEVPLGAVVSCVAVQSSVVCLS